MFDEETGLYYLRSRYYNSAWCSFLNADIMYDWNNYTYCRNSPIALIDVNGYEPMTCYFSDMGFGNLMIGIPLSGGCISDYTAENNDFPMYGIPFHGPDPVEKLINELKSYVGVVVKTAIRFASSWVAIKIAAYCTAAGGPIGFGISLLLTIPIGFLGGMTGKIVEDDLQPDGRLGGDMNHSDPMDIVKEGLSNSVAPIIPSSNTEINIIFQVIRSIFKKGIDYILE